MINTSDLIFDDQNLLRRWFDGPSWATWRVGIKAALAEGPLDADELALFHAVAGDRAPPRHRVRELIVRVVGNGGGGRDAARDRILARSTAGDVKWCLHRFVKFEVVQKYQAYGIAYQPCTTCTT